MAAFNRIIVIGAGAIGASVGALLHEQGLDVTLIARGAHGRALRDGLDLRLPHGSRRIRVPVALDIDGLELTRDDLLILSVMGHHTAAALESVPTEVPVCSLQNGTRPLEIIAARGHPLLAGVVYVPAERLGPGRTALQGSPVPGWIGLGPWDGHPCLDTDLPRALRSAGFRSEFLDDATPWVRAKLLGNLAGILVALCDAPHRETVRALQQEAMTVWRAAGLSFYTPAALAERVGELGTVDVDGRPRIGGSTRHALARAQHRETTLETEALHGPIGELGRRLGVDTPLNTRCIALAQRAAVEGWIPGCLSPDRLHALLVDDRDDSTTIGDE